MLKLVFELDSDGTAEWVKEHLEMYLERWGDIRLVSIEDMTEQMILEDINGKK